MVLLSVQGMDVAGIAKVTFTSPDRVRAVLNNFNEDGFESLYPKYSGGRPPTFSLPQRQEMKKTAPVAQADAVHQELQRDGKTLRLDLLRPAPHGGRINTRGISARQH